MYKINKSQFKPLQCNNTRIKKKLNLTALLFRHTNFVVQRLIININYTSNEGVFFLHQYNINLENFDNFNNYKNLYFIFFDVFSFIFCYCCNINV